MKVFALLFVCAIFLTSFALPVKRQIDSANLMEQAKMPTGMIKKAIKAIKTINNIVSPALTAYELHNIMKDKSEDTTNKPNDNGAPTNKPSNDGEQRSRHACFFYH